MSRLVSWFSCGAASAISTKIMLAEEAPVTIAYCRVREEHPDNMRFLKECEQWFNQEIIILENEKYKGSCFNIFENQFFCTPHGSPCTKLLKKDVRLKFQKDTDTIVFGYTSEEEDRFNLFIDRNNEVPVRAPLIEHHLTKENVLAMIQRAGINLPAMYLLGYEHNNCIGCVKGGMGYWNKIRVDFPARFKKYADLEKKQGYTILKDKNGPLYLHDLDRDRGNLKDEPAIECGLFCEAAERSYSS